MALKEKQTTDTHRGGFDSWLGSEASYTRFLANRELVEARKLNASADIFALATNWDEEDDGEIEDHWLLQKVGSIGIIDVKGCLVAGSSSWWSWRDEVGYEDIRNAGIAALNSGCSAVILKFTTGGGQVLGCGACADFLQNVLGRTVPLIAYTDTACLSAGIWLASACSNIYCSTTAEVGSIGVMGVSTEYSKMEKEYGVTRTVFRSTELKGYGNPYEKLTPEMAKQIKLDVAETAIKFVNQVAKGLGKSIDFVESTLHTGQSWYGDKALQLGLVSKNLTIDQLLVELQDKVSQNNTQNIAGGFTPPTSFSSQHQQPEITAMAATTFNAEAQAKIDKALADSAAILLANGQTEPPQGDAPPVGVPPVETQPTETPATDESASSVLALVAQNTELASKLGASTADLSALKLEVASLQAHKAATEANEQGLRDIAINAIQWAFTASGSAAPDTTALKALATPLLVAQHDMAKSMLVRRFGTGGQHSSSQEEEPPTNLEAAAQELDRAALLDLSRIRRNK